MRKRRTIVFIEAAELSTTPRRAFWFTITPDKPADIDPAVDYWQPQELPPRVGTENHFKMNVLGLPVKMISRFTEFDDSRRFVIEGVRPRVGRWTRMTNEVDELASGGTRYTVCVEVRYPIWGAPIAATMAAILRRSIRAALSRAVEIFGGARVEPS
jgi:hypothetical protein